MADFLFGNLFIELAVGRIGLRVRNVVSTLARAAALVLLLPVVRWGGRRDKPRDVRNVDAF